MNTTVLVNNWALVLAVIPLTIAIVLVSRSLLSRTANGQLRNVLADYRRAQSELKQAEKAGKKASIRLERLSTKAAQTKPRVLKEAEGAAEDAQSLKKIAVDRAQVAANHVRRVIHSEFPPVRQEKLRNRYLPQDAKSQGS